MMIMTMGMVTMIVTAMITIIVIRGLPESEYYLMNRSSLVGNLQYSEIEVKIQKIIRKGGSGWERKCRNRWRT